MPFLRAADEAALLAAVHDVESRSPAELVVAVRAASGSYRDADLFWGLLTSQAVLAFVLFSPWPFSVDWLLLDPLCLGLGMGLLSARLPALRRLLTTRGRRQAAVRAHALATFHEKGVDMTARRTGVLVYVSLLERAVEVVADRGLLAAVEPAAWRTAVAALEETVARGGNGSAVADGIQRLGAVLAAALGPPAADDTNELPDEVSA